MCAASSNTTRSGGSSGRPDFVALANACDSTACVSAVKYPRNRRWSCAGAQTYSVLAPRSRWAGSKLLSAGGPGGGWANGASTVSAVV